MHPSLREYLTSSKPKGLKPHPRVTQGGRAIEWFLEDVPCYCIAIFREGKSWIGSVLKANDDNRIVGIKIHIEELLCLDSMKAFLEEKV